MPGSGAQASRKVITEWTLTYGYDLSSLRRCCSEGGAVDEVRFEEDASECVGQHVFQTLGTLDHRT